VAKRVAAPWQHGDLARSIVSIGPSAGRNALTVASVEELKAGLMQAAQQAQQTGQQAQACIDGVDKTIAMLQAVARGTNHPKVREAIGAAEQQKQLLAQAVQRAHATAQAARDYMGVLG
jgi:hypothetical protein